MKELIRRFKAKRAEKRRDLERAHGCVLLNRNYGGDWYFCPFDRIHKDSTTTRTAKLFD